MSTDDEGAIHNDEPAVLWHPTRAAYNRFKQGLIDAAVPRFILETCEHEGVGFPVDSVIVTIPYDSRDHAFDYDEVVENLMAEVGADVFFFDGTCIGADGDCCSGPGTRQYYFYPTKAMAEAESKPTEAYLG